MAGPASRVSRVVVTGPLRSVRWCLPAGAEAAALFTADSRQPVASGGATEPLAGDERSGRR